MQKLLAKCKISQKANEEQTDLPTDRYAYGPTEGFEKSRAFDSKFFQLSFGP